MAKDYEAYWLVAAYSFFVAGNGDLPEGGSTGIVRRMLQTYTQLGGTIHYNNDVSSIIINKNKFMINTEIFDETSVNLYKIKKITTRNASGIRLKSGDMVEGDYVICACDINYTFRNLLNNRHTPKSVKAVYRNKKDNPVYSSFQVAFAVDGLMREVDDTLSFECDSLDVGKRAYDRITVKNYRVYGDYIAPMGKTVIQCSIVQYEDDYRFWEKLHRNRELYELKKKNTAEAVRYRILQRFPQYEGKIHILDSWTPYTYAARNNCYHGAYMRFITTMTNRNAFLSSDVKGLGNVFLASHWLRYPGGIPTAATMGRQAIERIEKLLKD